MNDDILVLRAVVRLSRVRRHVTIDALVDRVDADEGEVRSALRRLARLGLVTRTADSAAQLTLAGLTVGIASAPPRVRRRPLRRAA